MHYVIHGAHNAQGRPVITAMRAAGKTVFALNRTRMHEIDDRHMLVADYDAPDRLASAYLGATGVFVHLPLASEQTRLQYVRNIAIALEETRPGRVVVSTSGQIIDSPDSPLMQPADSALPTLLRCIADIGLSHAVVAPRIYLENLQSHTQI